MKCNFFLCSSVYCDWVKGILVDCVFDFMDSTSFLGFIFRFYPNYGS